MMGSANGGVRPANGLAKALLSKGLAALAVLALVMGLGQTSARSADSTAPTSSQTLVAAATADPTATFDVIVQTDASGDVYHAAAKDAVAQVTKGSTNSTTAVTGSFQSVPGVTAHLTGAQVLALARDGSLVVSPDVPVVLTGIDNNQNWYDTVQAHWYKDSPVFKASSKSMPTIAVIDSGVDAAAANLGNRFLGQIDLTSTEPNSGGDGWGHGTMVASLAASGDDHYAGANPAAGLLSIDVFNDRGEAQTSDVINAIDWVLAHKAEYRIRVVNLSLQEAGPSSFVYDPLDKAVERLWQSGIVVVASAGNYAVNGAQSGVLYAPGNDPFAITVGALDTNRNHDTKDDRTAPWSAYGYTEDGFRKPELSAPGRYLIGGAPIGSVLSLSGGQNPKLVKNSLLQLSGTSFAAPLVSGAAAALLGLHPEWTPDQVKGALMLSASALPSASNWAGGVGEFNFKTAVGVTAPPNPNVALNAFLIDDPDGGPTRVFDGDAWIAAVTRSLSPTVSVSGTASWGSGSSGSASWGSASWGSASWGSASWGSASWSAASWGSASWGSSFSSASQLPPVTQAVIADYATQDGNGVG